MSIKKIYVSYLNISIIFNIFIYYIFSFHMSMFNTLNLSV